ncbi:MAG: CRISPR-associated endoribonuclease Cas6 [Clostridia bacterium]|nr:CRISPR-associated endoribonuclease Cas6 [Clostridia bacterium]
MVYYDLKIVVMLKEDVRYEDTYQKISDFIAYAMLQDEETKQFHKENTYKMYNFCSLYPLEEDRIYKGDKMYTFDIKFVSLAFAMKIKQLLNLISSQYFKVIMSDIKTFEYQTIHKLITLTPCILTTNKGDYKIENDMELVKSRMIAGIEKKYQLVYCEKVTCDFIQSIAKINRTPIKLPYKNIHFLGNKFEITVKEDELSQKFAHLALATGLLEKNSQGYGFCKAR